MEPTTKTIVYATDMDPEDAQRLKLSIRSLQKFMGDDVNVILLTDAPKVNDVEKCDRIEAVNVEEAFRKIGFTAEKYYFHGYHKAALSRLLIPFLGIFNGLDRVVYLDTDILCKSSEVKNLFTVDLRDYEIVCAKDLLDRSTRHRKLMNDKGLSEEARSQLRAKHWSVHGTEALSYVNSGVVVMNLKKIKENISWYYQRLQWFEQALRHPENDFSFIDQDFFNLMIDYGPVLNTRYNMLYFNIYEDCVLQHFAGDLKGFMPLAAKELKLIA